MSWRILALMALLALAFAILVGFATSRSLDRSPSQTAAIGGPFQLLNTAGATVDQSLLKGKWSVVFFGFTHCPDVCPTTLFAMAQVEPLLGDRARKLQTVFISVDPERDTVAQMRAYAANDAFPRRLIALTGSVAQVDAVASAYRVYHQRVGSGSDYSVNHAAYSYLMNPHGDLACVLPYGLTPELTAAKISSAMQAGANANRC